MRSVSVSPSTTDSNRDSLLGRLRYSVADRPELVAIITFAIVFLIFALNARDFLTAYAISNFLTFGAVYGVVVVGVAFLMIAGEFDLSVGAIMAVAMYILFHLLTLGVPPVLAIILCLASGAALGLVNGLIVTNTRIPSFIVTLGSMLAYRGLARALGAGRLLNYQVQPRPQVFQILNGDLSVINQMFVPASNFRAVILWFLVLVVVMTVILQRSRFGNWAIAVGGSPGAAMTQGINVRTVKTLGFVLTGLLSAFAGTLFFAHRFSVNPLSGMGTDLIAVAASVIGGVLLTGGAGSIVGPAIGIILMSMLEQGLTSMGIAQEIFEGVTGFIIILSVLSNVFLGNQRQ